MARRVSSSVSSKVQKKQKTITFVTRLVKGLILCSLWVAIIGAWFEDHQSVEKSPWRKNESEYQKALREIKELEKKCQQKCQDKFHTDLEAIGPIYDTCYCK